MSCCNNWFVVEFHRSAKSAEVAEFQLPGLIRAISVSVISTRTTINPRHMYSSKKSNLGLPAFRIQNFTRHQKWFFFFLLPGVHCSIVDIHSLSLTGKLLCSPSVTITWPVAPQVSSSREKPVTVHLLQVLSFCQSLPSAGNPITLSTTRFCRSLLEERLCQCGATER